MNSKEAIELLSTCVADFEIDLEQCHEIAEIIQQQDKMLEKACLLIAEHEDCPLDAIGVRKYLQSEVGK